MDLTIIVVNRNGARVLSPCVRSIIKQTSEIEYELIVVDNASTDGSADRLAEEFPMITIVRNDRNIGFAAANNIGMRMSKGKFVLLLNPDTEVLDGALQKTVAFMVSTPRAGIVGCKLVYPDGMLQPSVRSFPTLWNIFSEAFFIYRILPKSRLFGKYYMTYFDYGMTSEVDWASGAFLMIRRNVIDRVGELDEQYFMYAEELDYCYRARQYGYSVIYFSGACIIHHWGGVQTTNDTLIYWGQKSQILFIEKHFTGIKKYMMISVKCVGIAIRIPMYVVAALVTLNANYLFKSLAYTRTTAKLFRQSQQ